MTRVGFPTAVWLVALVIAAICICASLLLLASPRWRGRSTPLFMRLAFFVLITLIGTEMLGNATGTVGDVSPSWPRHLGLGLLVTSGALVVAMASWRGPALWWRRWGRSALVLVISIGLAAATRWRFEESISDHVGLRRGPQDALQGVSFPVIEFDGTFALTDLGRRIPLEHFLSDESLESAKHQIPDEYTAHVIVDEATDSPANCHGWVFTEARYVIRSRYVDMILHDNGYRIVAAPGLGDLIVYRNAHGVPIHTGIVKAIGDAGFVLIESKWGSLDTYLHLPQDQIYSQGFAYYRSPRGTHSLKIMGRNGPT